MNKAMEKCGFSVLVVDDEPGMRTILKKALSKRVTQVFTASCIEDAETLRKRQHFDIFIVDINLPGRSGIEWHEVFSDEGANHDVIFMTGYAELETAIKALRVGACDFILKPFNLEQMLQAVQNCIDKRFMGRTHPVLQGDVSRTFPVDLVGDAPKTKAMRTLISQLAPSSSAVLIEGESGTGKELVARALHELSERKGPFVPINCAAISPELLESELFGHISGAFTGARKNKEGLFRVADKGTLFLDEISEMPLSMQASLLRAIEQKRVRPVGAEREMNVDVRIVAATNRHLSQEVQEGCFRHDLYYRLNVLSIELPALRERFEDVGPLLNYFSNSLGREMGLKPLVWSVQELEQLQKYSWPGNIRELKNTVERAFLLGKGHVFNVQLDASIEKDETMKTSFSALPLPTSVSESGYPVNWLIKEVERAHIEKVVEAHGGNKSSASRQLGLARKTLERKFKQWCDFNESLD